MDGANFPEWEWKGASEEKNPHVWNSENLESQKKNPKRDPNLLLRINNLS